MSQQPNALYTLPWSGTPTDERRFRIIVAAVLLLTIAFGAIISSVDVPELKREEAEKIPPRLAKIIMEKKKAPPPPPPPKPVEPEKKPEEKKPEEKKPEPKKPEKKPEQEKPKPKLVKKERKPETKPKADIEKARKKAANTGVLAMRDMLADLRESQPLDAITKPKSGLQTGGTTETKRSRSILTAKSTKGSGGIDTSKFSRSTAGTTLAERETTEVEDFVAALPDEVAASESLAAGQMPGRSDSEVQTIFDQNKASIYTLYQRELRRNPLLQGKVIFEITIEPDGTVSDCKIASSELNHKRLERKLVLKIKQINFGEKPVSTTVVKYPMDFFPNL